LKTEKSQQKPKINSKGRLSWLNEGITLKAVRTFLRLSLLAFLSAAASSKGTLSPVGVLRFLRAPFFKDLIFAAAAAEEEGVWAEPGVAVDTVGVELVAEVAPPSALAVFPTATSPALANG
jgi:hypothetical protein